MEASREGSVNGIRLGFSGCWKMRSQLLAWSYLGIGRLKT
ncbi:MAG: hypothetical protein N838_09725 [Thiohalocapsa sp. PB-PSB1]|nr:MAG: hypothetical protein N838_09725 [Thiohalocapsa sp. PB-PSB1]